jgi:hypothetical protein
MGASFCSLTPQKRERITHRLGCLTVGKSLDELQKCYYGKFPGGKSWLTVFGKEVRKHFILKKRPQFISHLDKSTAFGTGGFGHSSGLLGDWPDRFWFERHRFPLL